MTGALNQYTFNKICYNTLKTITFGGGSSKNNNHEKVRPSPSESATDYKMGDTKYGNDGNLWIIVVNKNGVNRWQKNK
jgi:hypothetical protein